MGKGSKQRPAADPRALEENWERIFARRKAEYDLIDAASDGNFGGIIDELAPVSQEQFKVALKRAVAPLLPDGADAAKPASVPRRTGGATAEEWIALVLKEPARTLPGGVGGMIVEHLIARLSRAKQGMGHGPKSLAARTERIKQAYLRRV